MMDTKQVKLTYDAIITVPSTMSVYMSADFFKHTNSGNMTSYYYEQTDEIHSNQIALVIGNLTESSTNITSDNSKSLKIISSPEIHN